MDYRLIHHRFYCVALTRTAEARVVASWQGCCNCHVGSYPCVYLDVLTRKAVREDVVSEHYPHRVVVLQRWESCLEVFVSDKTSKGLTSASAGWCSSIEESTRSGFPAPIALQIETQKRVQILKSHIAGSIGRNAGRSSRVQCEVGRAWYTTGGFRTRTCQASSMTSIAVWQTRSRLGKIVHIVAIALISVMDKLLVPVSRVEYGAHPPALQATQ